MGGSARYRYGKKIANAMSAGESEERIAELQRQMQEAIAWEKARKVERLALQTIDTTDRMISGTGINPVSGRTLSEASRLRDATPKRFHDTLAKTKSKQHPEDAWRVDVHSIKDYIKDNDKLFLTEGGSAIAVTPDGDIISVCRNVDDEASGSDILARAVEMGGVKLDSYAGNHSFYTKNGFEPVSWVKWDDRYAPPGWKEDRDKREPIIFYRYVGHKVTETADEFMARVKPSKRYSRGMNVRDKKINS